MYLGVGVKYESRCVPVKEGEKLNWGKRTIETLQCERGPAIAMVYAKDVKAFARWMSQFYAHQSSHLFRS